MRYRLLGAPSPSTPPDLAAELARRGSWGPGSPGALVADTFRAPPRMGLLHVDKDGWWVDPLVTRPRPLPGTTLGGHLADDLLRALGGRHPAISWPERGMHLHPAELRPLRAWSRAVHRMLKGAPPAEASPTGEVLSTVRVASWEQVRRAATTATRDARPWAARLDATVRVVDCARGVATTRW